MSTVSDETLSAFLDGELPDAERARVAAALGSDAALAARFAQLQQADAALKQAWPADAAGLPAGITAAIDRLAAAQQARTAAASQGKVVSLDARRAQAAAGAGTQHGAPGSPRAQWQRWSLAASILAVVGAGIVFLSQQQPAGAQFALAPASGTTLASGHPLAATLSETASGAAREWPGPVTRGGTVYPVLSFRDGTGALCREFEVADGRAVSMGVACRRSGSWKIEAIAPAAGRSATAEGYVPASGDVPAAVGAAIDRLMQGDALDAAAEAAALAE
jgi:negative regulator of sigma E activity